MLTELLKPMLSTAAGAQVQRAAVVQLLHAVLAVSALIRV